MCWPKSIAAFWSAASMTRGPGRRAGFCAPLHHLLVLRFGDSTQLQLDVELTDDTPIHELCVVPMALQTLVENAIKHNQVGSETPLVA